MDLHQRSADKKTIPQPEKGGAPEETNDVHYALHTLGLCWHFRRSRVGVKKHNFPACGRSCDRHGIVQRNWYSVCGTMVRVVVSTPTTSNRTLGKQDECRNSTTRPFGKKDTPKFCMLASMATVHAQNTKKVGSEQGDGRMGVFVLVLNRLLLRGPKNVNLNCPPTVRRPVEALRLSQWPGVHNTSTRVRVCRALYNLSSCTSPCMAATSCSKASGLSSADILSKALHQQPNVHDSRVRSNSLRYHVDVYQCDDTIFSYSNQRISCARSVRVNPHVCCQVYKVQVSLNNIVSDATRSRVHTTSIHKYPPSVTCHVPRCSILSQHISPMMRPNELPQNPIPSTPLSEMMTATFSVSAASYR